MLQVYVCIGSSCHLKGSYHIIKTFQELIKKHKLSSRVELKASFCLGHCTRGVSVKFENKVIEDVTPANARQKFIEHILNKL